MTTQGTMFSGADYSGASVLNFTSAARVQALNEGARGGYAVHHATRGVIAYLWPANRIAELEMVAYRRYVQACAAENLDAHGLTMWRVQGNPTGPL